MHAVRGTLLVLCASLAAAGCGAAAASGTSSFSVVIGAEPRAECRKVADLNLDGPSAQELRRMVKEHAASLGANYVQLTNVYVSRDTGAHRAVGVVFACR